jgi:hypothetical protein
LPGMQLQAHRMDPEAAGVVDVVIGWTRSRDGGWRREGVRGAQGRVATMKCALECAVPEQLLCRRVRMRRKRVVVPSTSLLTLSLPVKSFTLSFTLHTHSLSLVHSRLTSALSFTRSPSPPPTILTPSIHDAVTLPSLHLRHSFRPPSDDYPSRQLSFNVSIVMSARLVEAGHS